MAHAIIAGMRTAFVLLPLMLFTACIEPGEQRDRAHIVTSMANTLDKQFPGVPSVKKDEIPANAVLLDVREQNERMVSVLPHAISRLDFDKNRAQYVGRPIVVYDTLGQRALMAVSEMRAQNIEAYNLYGGILAWAHAGGEFVDVTGSTTKRVHVYAQAWDMLPDGFEAITQ